MALHIEKTGRTEVTKLVCPECGEKVKQIGLRKDSTIDGLSFKCKRCGEYFEVKTTKEDK